MTYFISKIENNNNFIQDQTISLIETNEILYAINFIVKCVEIHGNLVWEKYLLMVRE